MIYDIDNADLW